MFNTEAFHRAVARTKNRQAKDKQEPKPSYVIPAITAPNKIDDEQYCKTMLSKMLARIAQLKGVNDK